MLPDGLQFSTPAIIRITLDKSTDTQIPLLASISGQTVTALNPSRVELDSQTGKKTIIAALSHFSSVTVFDGNFKVTAAVQGNIYKVIGDTFSATANITRLERSEIYISSNPTATPVPYILSIWDLWSTWLAGDGMIQPTLISDAPARTETQQMSFQDTHS